MDIFVFVFELIGAAAFAISGAIKGIEKNMDVLGVSIMGLITAVGGGAVRDLILGINPPMVFTNSTFAFIAICVSIVIFIFYNLKNRLFNGSFAYAAARIYFFSDAIGLGAFTVVGIHTAYSLYDNASTFLLVFVGVVTGVGGGVLRDIMCCTIPEVFVKHIYACASILGAVISVLCRNVVGNDAAMIYGMITVVMIRILAMTFKLNLPKVSNKDKDI